MSDNGVHFIVKQWPVSALLLCTCLTGVWSSDIVINSCQTVALLSVAGPPTSNTARKRLTVNDYWAGFALAPQPITDPLIDGPGRRTGLNHGPGPTSRPAADSRPSAAGTYTTRGRRATHRSSRRGGGEFRLPACLALSGIGVNFLAIVASREHVAGQTAKGVHVVVEQDQHHRVDGRVRPRQEGQQLVDLGRLLELWVDKGQDVEGIPGEDEEDEDTRPAQGLSNNGAYQTLPGNY